MRQPKPHIHPNACKKLARYFRAVRRETGAWNIRETARRLDVNQKYVHDNLINGIRWHVDEINAAGGENLAGLKPGETVVIQGGPFVGYEAILDVRLPGSERVRVLLKLLQAQIMNVELPASQIQRKVRR